MFVIMLTLTAVTLSLFGISTTIASGWIRGLFVGLGITISLTTVLGIIAILILPTSLWFYLNAGITDLDDLLAVLEGNPKSWTIAPSPSNISGDHSLLINEIQVLLKEINETIVGLEFSGARPTPFTLDVVTSPFEFAQEIYDENGDFLEYDIQTEFPYGTNEVIVLFDYSGFLGDHQEIWKIYRDGLENPPLRVISNWALGSEGSGAKPTRSRLPNQVL